MKRKEAEQFMNDIRTRSIKKRAKEFIAAYDEGVF
jgi:hypothetical protein